MHNSQLVFNYHNYGVGCRRDSCANSLGASLVAHETTGALKGRLLPELLPQYNADFPASPGNPPLSVIKKPPRGESCESRAECQACENPPLAGEVDASIASRRRGRTQPRRCRLGATTTPLNLIFQRFPKME